MILLWLTRIVKILTNINILATVTQITFMVEMFDYFWEQIWQFFKKLILIPYNSLLYSKAFTQSNGSKCSYKTLSLMFMAALFTITPNCKQSTCPSSESGFLKLYSYQGKLVIKRTSWLSLTWYWTKKARQKVILFFLSFQISKTNFIFRFSKSEV